MLAGPPLGVKTRDTFSEHLVARTSWNTRGRLVQPENRILERVPLRCHVRDRPGEGMLGGKVGGPMKRFSPRCLLPALAATLLAPLASAIWSILIVDKATGEIAVAQATCIVGPNLQNKLAVVIPGVGGACVQAWWDNAGVRRTLIWEDFLAGSLRTRSSPISTRSGVPQLYQYGIVDALGRTGTYTGSSAGGWAGGRVGSEGNLAWAIQGNVLAGEGVAIAAEDAIRNTPGALPEKIVAAMLAAASMGGDGRCSCSSSNPDSCGTPPPGFDLTTSEVGARGFHDRRASG